MNDEEMAEVLAGVLAGPLALKQRSALERVLDELLRRQRAQVANPGDKLTLTASDGTAIVATVVAVEQHRLLCTWLDAKLIQREGYWPIPKAALHTGS